ncbi:MAG TPA: hypothetical protein DCG44_00970 [Candidatus Aquiluna sp.]|jgi:hypothetical protein|uniref:hypothetical protein n=1 Tax=Aquiluna sp. TaxID=2053504 RepID=UPI00071361A9|nr:MAG: hypothetical protein ABR68_03130 [Microbacteriaceae bacterium BACL28 MAG-120531-bin53]HAE73778.1 hypothetical protein [Aquiluna sp.]
MENSAGLGGIALVLAAVVWLFIFVPGYTKRSQINETTKLIQAARRTEEKSRVPTDDDRLRRLLSTQRGFSIIFILATLASIASVVAATAQNSWWFGFAIALPLSFASLFIQRAAANQAAKLAGNIHRSRQRVRANASKSQTKIAKDRQWSPNPLPKPMTEARKGELLLPLAEVIEISAPKKSLASKEIDEILARRRAI